MSFLSRSSAPALASLLLCACAQLLGTDDYEVDPDFTGTDSPLDVDSGSEPSTDAPTTDATEPTESDPSDTEPTEPSPGSTDDGGPGTSSDDTNPSDESDATDPTEPPPDGGDPEECAPPVLGTCDTAPQCGCGAGQLCDVVDPNTGRTGCVPAGTTAPYASCSFTQGECQAGYGCIGGVCKELCDPEETEFCNDRPFERCSGVVNLTGDPIPGFNFCQRTCDPRDPTAETTIFQACGEGANCSPGINGESYCLASASNGTQGASCEGPSGPNPFACAPGFSCIVFASNASCMRNCTVGGTDCDRGLSCFSYTTPLSAAHVEIGYCDICPPLSGNSCDPVTQCGCGGSEMCAVVDWSTGATGCLPEGTIPEGGSCWLEVGECAPGTECMEWLENGVCSSFCNQDTDCPHGLPCVDWELPGIKQCLHGCDPRQPQSDEAPFHACQPDQGCTIWSDAPESSVCTTPSILGNVGEPCTGEEECAPGLTCGGDGGTTCARWCATGSEECPTGEACMPHQWLSNYLDEVVVSGVRLGVCTPPAFDGLVSTPAPIPDATEDDAGFVESSIAVSGAPTSISLITVELTINHPYVGDLGIILIAPDDSFVVLFDSFGLDLDRSSGDNLVATSFTDDASTLVTDARAPFTGSFRPTEPLSAFQGLDANGFWTLVVFDRTPLDTGTLQSWRLRIY